MRRIARKNKNGTTTAYIQLAHNYRDPKTGVPKAKVLHSFGREDELDVDSIRRLIKSMCRFLSPEEALGVMTEMDGDTGPFDVEWSRDLGGPWLLDQLWQKLGIRNVLEKLLKDRRYQVPVERAVFSMVANRALEPSSKLKVEEWVQEDVIIDDLPEVAVQQLYRAMDFVLESEEDLQREVYWSVANLLNLEVDLLYFDTTSTYFEIEDEDEGEDGFRKRGHSKDKRRDLPQAIIGLAVTREGIPVRCWAWPGNTADMSVVSQVKKDLTNWKLGRVITVLDRGFSSKENLKELQKAGGHYIVGDKMRSGKPEVNEAMKRPGRYHEIRENLRAKEIVVGDGEARHRYVLVHNPAEAKRQKAKRGKIIENLKAQLAQIKDLPPNQHTKAVCALVSHRTYGRYLRSTKAGRPRIDMKKVRDEERYDGKYLLKTSDDTLSTEDVALGYKQLMDVERAFRTLKSQLDLRPVYHRLEDRIRAHVLLCWLALLLVRIIENATGETWTSVKTVMDRMKLVKFKSKDGSFLQRTDTTPRQKSILSSLELKEPPIVHGVEPGRRTL